MLTILMNYLFVLAIGILIGHILAFIIFQDQLKQILHEHYFENYEDEYLLEKLLRMESSKKDLQEDKH